MSSKGIMVGRLLSVVMLVLGLIAASQAEIRVQGEYTAEQECPVFVSIRKKTNPGKARLTPGRRYKVVAANAASADWYLIRVPGARPRERWAAASCGYLGGKPKATTAPPVTAGRGPEYVFALTWQPAFCQMRGSKPECKGQSGQRFDADHFSLHGLWPQPRNKVYCGVSASERKRSWSRIPPLQLGRQTRSQLERAMPGTASNLQRHEWLKHGTCYGKSADAYFQDALALLKQVNRSAVQKLFADNIGSRISAAGIRAAADQSFGSGAGAKIVVNCRQGMITELQLQLRGNIESGADIGKLLHAAADAPLRCSAGRVDRAGH